MHLLSPAPHYPACVVRKAFIMLAALTPLVSNAAWFRGNTHAHTVNSSGDAAPDTVARWYRDAKVFQLVEGANDIHRMLIARQTLRGLQDRPLA